MARVVETVASHCCNTLQVDIVETKQLAGALRHGEMSKRLGRPAPVPSIWVNGRLAFDRTPSPEVLQEYLNALPAE